MGTIVAAAFLAIAIALAVAGCDDDDGDAGGAQPVPAAGELTPSGATPGVPAGAGYDVSGSEWLELEDLDRLEATEEYIADHPADCSLGEDIAAADPVRDFADSSLGTDYPLAAPVSELLAEGCAAALQSGKQGLAAP